MSSAFCHISVTVWILSNGKTSDVVIFEQITDTFRPFFLMYYNSCNFCLRSCKSHSKKMKSSWVQRAIFHTQLAYCLKTEAFVVLSIWSISWCKSNRSKRDEHWSLTFPIINRVKMFPFSSLVIKVWRAKPKYSHLVFLAFLASIMQITLVKSSRRQGVDRHAQIAYRLKKET